VIPALKDESQLAADAPSRVAFLLCGDICTVGRLIGQLHAQDRRAVVHADLITGLAQKEIAVDFLRRCGADGIISTRPPMIRRGRELGLLTVMRFFAIDSKAVSNLARETAVVMPDVIEVLPGAIPRVIGSLVRELPVPLIAGGLLRSKADILAALGAGAMCVSTSDVALWAL
jgi:glycerol uptake operon antiterminator